MKKQHQVTVRFVRGPVYSPGLDHYSVLPLEMVHGGGEKKKFRVSENVRKQRRKPRTGV